MKDQDNERMNETEAEKEIMPDYLIGRGNSLMWDFNDSYSYFNDNE